MKILIFVWFFFLVAVSGHAQETSENKDQSSEGQPGEDQPGEDQPGVTETMTVVYDAEDYRYRSDETRPVLVYGKEFFQRFEPLSVGDILKRIPGISGSAEAGQFDLPQLRGIGPEYTQILINGRRVPGADNNRTLFVDRIPANMVERLEITRSPSSDMDAQGIGGTINIVLKEAHKLQELGILAGLAHFERDDTLRGQGFVSYGSTAGKLAYSLKGGVVQRYNPKKQQTDIFETEGGQVFKDENNTLDSDESSFQADMTLPVSERGVLSAQALWMSTDRSEIEDASFFREGEFEEGTFDHGMVRQDNWGGNLQYEYAHSRGGAFHLDLDYHRLELDNRLDVGTFEGAERDLEEIERNRTEDTETKLRAYWTLPFLKSHELKLGVDWSRKRRDAGQRIFEVGEEGVELADASGVFRLTEARIDPYLATQWTINAKLDVQAGLRVEITDLQFEDGSLDQTDTQWFPSVHYRYRKTPRDIFRLSLARATKRPDFEELQPFEKQDQPRDDQVTVGNPNLKPEFSFGLDLGYEHYFAEQEGIIGWNLFYREIEDRIETIEISEDRFQPRNVDTGKVYGLELDLGLPLTKLGMPHISLYANLTLQDSEQLDPLTGQERRFNFQSDYLFNLGLLHYLPAIKASYGFNWLQQGDAEEFFATESAIIQYGDNLEFLFEKRWKNGLSLRLSGRNLLNGTRDEIFKEYEGIRGNGNVSLMSFESEESGRAVTLTLRGVFGTGSKN